jgi:hypothetical protein
LPNRPRLQAASIVTGMTKPKPKDQLQKRGRKSVFRPEYILIAKACTRFGAIEEEIADELHINHATLDNWKKKYPTDRRGLHIPFHLKQHVIGHDRDGDAITECTVERGEDPNVNATLCARRY